MAKPKEVKEMNVELKSVTTKPKINALNLETMQEEGVEVSRTEYKAPAYDPKEHGDDENAFTAAVLAAAEALVGSVSNRIDALLRYASQMSYQDGKTAAFSNGKYLTREIANTVCTIMQANSKFADMGKGDVLNAFKAGVLAGKPGALKVLKLAQEMTAAADLDI